MVANSWKKNLRDFLKDFYFSYFSKTVFNLKMTFSFLYRKGILFNFPFFFFGFSFPPKEVFQSAWILMEINCWVFDSQKECVSIPGKWQLSPQQHSSRSVQDHSAANQQKCWVPRVSTTCMSLVSKWAERRLISVSFKEYVSSSALMQILPELPICPFMVRDSMKCV